MKVRALGYVGAESPEAKQWEEFGPEILGLQLVDGDQTGSVYLRMDERHHRLAIHPGAKDRLAYLTDFLAAFYNTDELMGKRVSKEVVRDSWNIAAGASPIGTWSCPPTWHTDFRDDLGHIDVPTLVLHGDADRILPIEATGARTHAAIEGSSYLVVEGAPHGLLWTHAEEVNRALLNFLAAGAKKTTSKGSRTVTA